MSPYAFLRTVRSLLKNVAVLRLPNQMCSVISFVCLSTYMIALVIP